MNVRIDICKKSKKQRLYRKDQLRRLATNICESEGCTGTLEISLLLCDDAEIAELNRKYRKKSAPTDVLSFPQPGAPLADVRYLGDIVISLETVEARCGGKVSQCHREVGLLFCHGLLHLLGYDHETPAKEESMRVLQARYLGVTPEAAWETKRSGAKKPPARKRTEGTPSGRR